MAGFIEYRVKLAGAEATEDYVPFSAPASITVGELVRRIYDALVKKPAGRSGVSHAVSLFYETDDSQRVRIGRNMRDTRLADHPVLRNAGTRLVMELRSFPAWVVVLSVVLGAMVFLLSAGLVAFLGVLLVKSIAGARARRSRASRSAKPSSRSTKPAGKSTKPAGRSAKKA
jgi:hypothetical protein